MFRAGSCALGTGKLHYQDGIYFITTVTYNRFPYFEEPIFRQVLIKVIHFNRRIKNFELFDFVVDKTHLHLLTRPQRDINISEIMRSIKTNSSREINKILYVQYYEGDVAPRRLHKRKQYPDFKWQKSFYDHLIRNKNDFFRHLNYIKNHQGYKKLNS